MEIIEQLTFQVPFWLESPPNHVFFYKYLLNCCWCQALFSVINISLFNTEGEKSVLSCSIHPSRIWCHSPKCLCLERSDWYPLIKNPFYFKEILFQKIIWGSIVMGEYGMQILIVPFYLSVYKLRLNYEIRCDEPDGYCIMRTHDPIHSFIHSCTYLVSKNLWAWYVTYTPMHMTQCLVSQLTFGYQEVKYVNGSVLPYAILWILVWGAPRGPQSRIGP